MIERGVARLAEIVKREGAEFARNPSVGEKVLNEILGPVGGTGIADHPAVNVVGDRSKAALDIRHFVLDDHVEAESFDFGHSTLSVCAQFRIPTMSSSVRICAIAFAEDKPRLE